MAIKIGGNGIYVLHVIPLQAAAMITQWMSPPLVNVSNSNNNDNIRKNSNIYNNTIRIIKTFKWRMLRVTNLNGLPHSLLSYGHLIPGERACTGRACTGRTCLIKKFFQGPSKGRYIPWAVPEDSGYWLSGVLRGWSANG